MDTYSSLNQFVNTIKHVYNIKVLILTITFYACQFTKVNKVNDIDGLVVCIILFYSHTHTGFYMIKITLDQA